VEERELGVGVGEVDFDELGAEVGGWEVSENGGDQFRGVDVEAFPDEFPLGGKASKGKSI